VTGDSVLSDTQLAKIAASRLTAVIYGESGTGKSRLAHQLHQSGPRAAQPFISISCAAMPRDLLESELFGHERGAFSGAHTSKPGRVELAHNGTLFLDEIGDLPLELQPKLLTFLQERSFYRLGGRELRSVDVRIIAATNKDLATEVKENKFREDLYYRLSVLTIQLKPLRQRPEEIPVLALKFLKEAAREFGNEAPSPLSPNAVDVLLKHPWPGNIRELENAMYRAATLVDPESAITPELINPSRACDRAELFTQQPVRRLEEVEEEALRQALHHFGNNKTKAARALGVSLKTIYNKLKHYGIQA